MNQHEMEEESTLVDPSPPDTSGADEALSFLDDLMCALREEEMATSAQKLELAEFIKKKDASSKLDTDQLLTMFKLNDVATAVFKKYGSLPATWEVQPNTSYKTNSISDMKINEILDTEMSFLSGILELQKTFLDPLYDIFGSGNKEVIKNLGITQEETNQIFEQLPQICRFSQALMQKLEIISLVRTPPVTGEGRAIYVGRAFVEMAPKLHLYAPAITTYQQSLQVLTLKTNKLAESKKSNKGDFVHLWEKVTETHPVLRGKQLNAVLITPMQRIPRYRMLLEQLVKDCDHEDSIAVVQDALDLYSSAAKNINEAVRSHEKLVDFFGAGSELKPMSSTGGATKDGEVKVVNSYTNKVIGS